MKPVSVFDERTATIGGVTKTWTEWCTVFGKTRSAVRQMMKLHGIPFEAAILPRKRGRPRKTGNDDGSLDGRSLELTLASHPTPEIVEMCTHCKHKDCDSTILQCLKEKRERQNDQLRDTEQANSVGR